MPPRLGDKGAGNAIRALLREAHVQILAAAAVGIADHVNRRLFVLFQHHRDAGERIGSCRFEVGAAAIKGDVIGHIQHDVIAISRHADPGSLHFLAQFGFLYVHVVADAAAKRRARRRADQRPFTAVVFGRGERANTCADQGADARADAGFSCFTFAGIGVGCTARNGQCAANHSRNHQYAFFILFP